MMFKKGDVVLRVTGSHHGMHVGDKDTVLSCDERDMALQYHGGWHDPSNFELVNEAIDLTPGELYLATAKACSIKAGDTVRLLRPFVDYEMGIKLLVGSSCRPEYIGTTGVVDRMRSDGAFVVSFGGAPCHFYYPWFVLERVEKPPFREELRLNGSYSAVVTKDKVEVGCQVFTHKVVAALYAASCKAQQ